MTSVKAYHGCEARFAFADEPRSALFRALSAGVSVRVAVLPVLLLTSLVDVAAELARGTCGRFHVVVLDMWSM